MQKSISPDLPELCYHIHDVTGEPVVIKRGVTGFFSTGYPAENAIHLVDRLNDKLGVSSAQKEAMIAGSLFGFGLPIATPVYFEHRS